MWARPPNLLCCCQHQACGMPMLETKLQPQEPTIASTVHVFHVDAELPWPCRWPPHTWQVTITAPAAATGLGTNAQNSSTRVAVFRILLVCGLPAHAGCMSAPATLIRPGWASSTHGSIPTLSMHRLQQKPRARGERRLRTQPLPTPHGALATGSPAIVRVTRS